MGVGRRSGGGNSDRQGCLLVYLVATQGADKYRRYKMNGLFIRCMQDNPIPSPAGKAHHVVVYVGWMESIRYVGLCQEKVSICICNASLRRQLDGRQATVKTWWRKSCSVEMHLMISVLRCKIVNVYF